MKKPKTPALQVNFYLVGHGYQMDIVNHLGGDQDAQLVSVCRDFAGSYDVTEIAAAVEAALPKMMQKLERDYLQPRVIVVRESEDSLSSAISAARTILVTRPRDTVELHVKPCSMKQQEQINDLLLNAGLKERFKIVYDDK